MDFDLTNYENITVAFALVLVVIFALAAFFDYRWRKAGWLPTFGSGHQPSISPESTTKTGRANLYAHYADSNARRFGTAQQRITFRSECCAPSCGGSRKFRANRHSSSLSSRRDARR